MDTVTILYLGLLGAAIGSFLNLSIDRLPLGLSLLGPPSRCDQCYRPIPVVDLVPIFNFLWLRGKCRRCKATIPLRALVVETIVAILVGTVAWRYGISIAAGVLVVYISLLVVIAAIDLERGVILNSLVFLGTLLAIAIAPLGPLGEEQGMGGAYVSSLAGAGVGFGVVLLVYLLLPGSIGAGDVKLAGMMGAVLGLSLLPVGLLTAFITGGIVASVLLLTGRKARKDLLPFGPFLTAGALTALLAGEAIGSWYLGLFS